MIVRSSCGCDRVRELAAIEPAFRNPTRVCVAYWARQPEPNAYLPLDLPKLHFALSDAWGVGKSGDFFFGQASIRSAWALVATTIPGS